MYKEDFAKLVAEKAEISKEKAIAVIDAYGIVITEALQKGEKVQITGFGTYEKVKKSQRVGRNPQTGEQITIPASNKPKFKPGKALTDALN